MVTESKTGSLGIQNAYQLRLLFGDKNVLLSPNAIEEFSITCDMNRFLPAFHLRMLDSQGLFVHIAPCDHSLSKVCVEIRRGGESELEQYNRFEFDVYEQEPEAGVYDIRGLLTIDNLFLPQKTRGFGGTIKTTLETIAAELGVENTDISISLDYNKNLVQASWTNAQFLHHLKNNISGETREVCFYTFIKNIFVSGKAKEKILVFKCYNEFIREKPKYNFMIGGGQAILKDERGRPVDYHPVFDYKMLNSYKTLGLQSTQSQTYMYFNINNSQLVCEESNLRDYFSLSEYLLMDINDPDYSLDIYTGRSNQFIVPSSQARGVHYRNTTNLVKMWITIDGLEDIAPGDIIKIKIMLPSSPKFELEYLYQGYWMVERVVHTFGMAYTMRLLLTRGGIDTTYNTSLVAATKRKLEVG